MNDKDKIAAQQAIIEELKKEMAEIEAAKRKVLKGIPQDEIDAFNRYVDSLPY